MANTIQIKRGANASLPTLSAGELGFSTDTYQVYIGDGAANHEIATVAYVDNSVSTREIVNLTDASLSVTNLHAGKCIDCSNAGTQTLTFATLVADDTGMEWFVTKLGAGNVTIVCPAGVTFAEGDSSITLVSIGYECKIRYNHTNTLLIISYSGEII